MAPTSSIGGKSSAKCETLTSDSVSTSASQNVVRRESSPAIANFQTVADYHQAKEKVCRKESTDGKLKTSTSQVPLISEEDLAKEGEEFGKNALKNFEEEEMDDMDDENTASRPHFDVFDKQRGTGTGGNFPPIHELTTENVANILGGDFSRSGGGDGFDDMRGDPERPKEPDSESLRVIPSGPSSCNTVYDDSDFSSQPSVPTSNGGGNGHVFENENRSSSSCSGGNGPTVSASSSQQQPLGNQQVQQQSVPVTRGPVLVMPPHQQIQPQNQNYMSNHSQSLHSQSQATPQRTAIQKGIKGSKYPYCKNAYPFIIAFLR